MPRARSADYPPAKPLPTGIACKRRLFLAEVERWVGIREKAPHRGEIVSLFQGWNDKVVHVAWCMVFVQYCLKQTDLLYDRLAGRSTRLRHGIYPTEHVMTAWQNTPKEHRRQAPAPGLIAVWQRYREGAPTFMGHTGVVVRASRGAETFLTVEGNTVFPCEDGFVKGVAKKERHCRPSEGLLHLRGFLDPWLET